MNWERLFEAQAELDKHIVEEKGLQGQDLLDKKILALQVELGELANEWRGFKFWSEDQEPRNIAYFTRDDFGDGELFEIDKESFEICHKEGERNDPKYDSIQGKDWDIRYPLLEEFVDCLHFILSIGNELEVQKEIDITDIRTNISITGGIVVGFQNLYRLSSLEMFDEYDWVEMVEYFNGLGALLGFTEEQIEDAYFSKNKINHERQENAY
ncbi:dUTP diphosphatase [Paraliobacillus ryukyuensis]|uniref:dUTP diphosphatase n=1 Tax=Paraliobacillus ryukyuensis TaxID=200904 RepID=UPI0009A6EEA0|nr:dUTP diphosphatase [Paraliobacillus ryukyuensis]